jgi:hypothetical protein
MIRTRTEERGTILVAVLLAVFLMGTLTLLAVGTAKSVSDRLSFQKDDERLVAIGEAVLNLAIGDVWGEYVREAGGTPGSIGQFRDHLDAKGFTCPKSSPTDVTSRLRLAAGPDSGAALAGAEIHRVELARVDGEGTVLIRISVTLGFGPEDSGHHSRTVERGFYISGAPFRGLEFGLLANNVNCIMCHARFDNADRFYNRDPEKYGTWPRVRVGTLESLLIRATSADSVVAGTI